MKNIKNRVYNARDVLNMSDLTPDSFKLTPTCTFGAMAGFCAHCRSHVRTCSIGLLWGEERR